MNHKAFNFRFRPLVREAWKSYASISGMDPANKLQQDAWYRSTLRRAIRKDSTAGITDQEQRQVISVMAAIAEARHEVPIVHGWTPAQQEAFEELVLAAWKKQTKPDSEFIPWLHALTGLKEWIAPGKSGRTAVFDRVMLALGVEANNDYWIRRTACQDEIRLRWQIRQLLADLDELDWSQPHHWDYVRGIWHQAHIQPLDDLDDAPADALFKVFQMLDTHVRRLASAARIDLSDLPSRRANSKVPAVL